MHPRHHCVALLHEWEAYREWRAGHLCYPAVRFCPRMYLCVLVNRLVWFWVICAGAEFMTEIASRSRALEQEFAA